MTQVHLISGGLPWFLHEGFTAFMSLRSAFCHLGFEFVWIICDVTLVFACLVAGAAYCSVCSQVPVLEVTDKSDVYGRLLSTFQHKENKGINFVPVFVSLGNVSRIEMLVEGAVPVQDERGGDKERVVDSEDSICGMLLEHSLVDIQGGGKLKAMIVFDEADQVINGNVDSGRKGGGEDVADAGINKRTESMFTTERSVGRLRDKDGAVVSAKCLFDLFTATLDVTATPYSLFFSGRDLKPRTHTGIITGNPSKYGFQYIKRPSWKSKLIDCVEVPHDDGGVALMIDDMLRSNAPKHVPKRSRFAAVVDKTTRQKLDQRTQALKYAARYGDRQLITATWSAAGVSVFTTNTQEDEESDDKESSDSDAESDSARVDTRRDALTLVHDSFNVEHLMRTEAEYTTMYKSGTEWLTAEDLASTIRGDGAKERAARTKEAVDAAKASAKMTPTGGVGCPLLYMSTEGEWELWETEESLEARVQSEIEQNTTDLIAGALKQAERRVQADGWVVS